MNPEILRRGRITHRKDSSYWVGRVLKHYSLRYQMVAKMAKEEGAG